MLLDFWLKDYASSDVKFAHPFHPMQSYHMHKALHDIQGQHHADSRKEKDEASEDRDLWLMAG